ncbi:hypothetical protein I553_7239 [Mycobacterium xenopi 4042]|uniref:GmrSD restriction endonucleases C-terminal domain-containing protein n=1 Tax=Mycobacterium xenopi 4042 TaxID=1299334 RepID=X8E8B7_MYCXE|nr:hypothetical protein I553_7239 [Mycobacterium xenopi 4042]
MPTFRPCNRHRCVGRNHGGAGQNPSLRLPPAAFGDAWDDDNDAPGGHNGCDTRDDILNRDLTDKTYVSIKRCPDAVATGTLHDPYTNATIHFQRGARVGQSVQIDHIVPLALAWDMGAYNWPYPQRLRFANDPANLLAVSGQANEDKADSQPALWMPPNTAFWCQYAVQYVAVLRGYALPVDQPSADVLHRAAATCPPDNPQREQTRNPPNAAVNVRFCVCSPSLGVRVGQRVLAHAGAVVEAAERVHVLGG